MGYSMKMTEEPKKKKKKKKKAHNSGPRDIIPRLI